MGVKGRTFKLPERYVSLLAVEQDTGQVTANPTPFVWGGQNYNCEKPSGGLVSSENPALVLLTIKSKLLRETKMAA